MRLAAGAIVLDPWAAILAKASDYGPWGLVIAALCLAVAWSSVRNAKLQDMRVEDGKTFFKAMIENTTATDQLTKAMAARTDTMGDWSRQMITMVDAMKGLQTTQSAFLQTLSDRDRDSRQFDRDRGAR